MVDYQGPPLPMPPPPPPLEIEAFKLLITSQPKKKKQLSSKFVKWLDEIPSVALPPEGPMRVALSLANQALVGQFMGLCPSPKTIEA